MVLLLSVPNGAAGAQLELDSPATGMFLSRVVDLSGVPDPAFGAQTAWAINSGTGSDTGAGTPADPLRTMAEFNRRMAAPMLVTAVAVLQLVGDVIDAPLWLRGTAFASGASLTVQGTVTNQAGVATITNVASLNPAGAGTLQPWQLTTTGKDWTTVALGSRLLLSNGAVGWIRSVIDANNVVVGTFTTLATAAVTPAIAQTITLQTLSRALPPNLQVQAQASTVVVNVFDLSLDTSNIVTTAPFQGNLLFFGCEHKVPLGGTNTVSAVGGLQIRGARFSMAAGSPILAFRSGAGILNVFSAVYSGATTGTITPNLGSTAMQHTCIQSATLSCQSGAFVNIFSSFNLQHTTVGVLIDTAAVVSAGVCVVTGSAGISVGLDCRWGTFTWSGAANRPTITGGTADCRVAFVPYAYAALGTGKTSSLLDAIPPVATPVVNSDPSRGPGIATISQAG